VASEIPSGEGSVFHFLDIYALGFGLEACGALFLGKSWWWVALGVLGSIFFHLLGTNWPRIKPNIWPRLASALEWISSNRLYRRSTLTLITVAFLVSVGLALYRHYHRPSLIQSAPSTQTIASSVKVESSAPIASPKPKAQSPVKAVPRKKIAQPPVAKPAPPPAGIASTVKPDDCPVKSLTVKDSVFSDGSAPDLSNTCQSRVDNSVVKGTDRHKFTISGKDNAITNNTVTNMDVAVTKDADHTTMDRNLIQSGVPSGVVPEPTNGHGAKLANIWAAQAGAPYKCDGPCGTGPWPDDTPLRGVPSGLPLAKALHGSSRFVADQLSALIDEGNSIAYTFAKDDNVDALKKNQKDWQAKIDIVMSNLDPRLGEALNHVTSDRCGGGRNPEGIEICKSIAGKSDLMTIYQNTLRGVKD
jgi:hypothetical protein